MVNNAGGATVPPAILHSNTTLIIERTYEIANARKAPGVIPNYMLKLRSWEITIDESYQLESLLPKAAASSDRIRRFWRKSRPGFGALMRSMLLKALAPDAALSLMARSSLQVATLALMVAR